jgi:alanine racemase
MRVWAEINLDALAHNIDAIRRRCATGTRVMLVVKADAYGHGAVAIAHHAVHCGIGALGVGTSAEALELRQGGLRQPILVLGTVVEEELSACLRHRVQIGLHSSDRCLSLQARAKSLGVVAEVHLNIDTGMGRLGVLPSRAIELLTRVREASHLRLAGVMTHISAPDGLLNPQAKAQTEAFQSVLERARARNLLAGWVHVANSAGVFTGLDDFDTVRPGIAAYGALPSALPGADELQPVMSLRSQVVFLKDVPAGTPVGYGSSWRAERPTRIATLPVGYNDGVSWRLGGVGEVLLRGQRAPIVGQVSMDYTTVDVGAIAGIEVGDVATLIGRDGDLEIRLEEVARKAQTIPYEISCSVGKRVARIYGGGEDFTIPAQAPPQASPAAHELKRAQEYPESRRLAELEGWFRP